MSLAFVQSKPTAEEKMCSTGVSLRFSLFSHEYLWAGMWMEPSTNDCTVHFLCSQGTCGCSVWISLFRHYVSPINGTCTFFTNGPSTGPKARYEFEDSNISSPFFVLSSVNLRWYLAWIMSCVLCRHSRIWRILAQRCQAKGWKKRRVDPESVDNFDHFDWHHWCWICWIWAMTCLQHQVRLHIAIARGLHVWKELLKLMDQRKEQVSTSEPGTAFLKASEHASFVGTVSNRDEHFVVGPSRILSTFSLSWGHEELDWRQNYWCCLSWRKRVTS